MSHFKIAETTEIEDEEKKSYQVIRTNIKKLKNNPFADNYLFEFPWKTLDKTSNKKNFTEKFRDKHFLPFNVSDPRNKMTPYFIFTTRVQKSKEWPKSHENYLPRRSRGW